MNLDETRLMRYLPAYCLPKWAEVREHIKTLQFERGIECCVWYEGEGTMGFQMLREDGQATEPMKMDIDEFNKSACWEIEEMLEARLTTFKSLSAYQRK